MLAPVGRLKTIFSETSGIHSSLKTVSYETHSAVKRSNAVLCKRMRGATDKSRINSGCMQKHTREKKAALLLQ